MALAKLWILHNHFLGCVIYLWVYETQMNIAKPMTIQMAMVESNCSSEQKSHRLSWERKKEGGWQQWKLEGTGLRWIWSECTVYIDAIITDQTELFYCMYF